MSQKVLVLMRRYCLKQLGTGLQPQELSTKLAAATGRINFTVRRAGWTLVVSRRGSLDKTMMFDKHRHC